MTDVRDTALERARQWTLTRASLHRLLNWLDGGVDSDGRSYVGMRRRLTDYFRRKNCLVADDLADETLSRVARRLEEEGITIADTPARYCYIVARFVFLEYLRDSKSRPTVADPSTIVALQTPAAAPADAAAAVTREQRLDSLEKCLQELDALNRRIITRYYIGSERVKIENRRQLAESLGLSANALMIRASRIRRRLEACVRRRDARLKGFPDRDLS